MTATAADATIRELPLPATGELRVRIASGSVVLLGHDEPVVRVRSTDGRPLDRVVGIEETPDGVTIGRSDDEVSLRLGPVRIGTGTSADLEIRLPRTAAVHVTTASADVTGTDLAGPLHIGTTSGDVRLATATTEADVRTVSGDLELVSSRSLRVTARSVSGDVDLRAPRFESLACDTTSGDIDIAGALADGSHELRSVSGDARIATGSPVRIEGRSVAGDLESRIPHRREGDGRFGTPSALVVGAGTALVRWQSMSGDLRLLEGPGDPSPSPAAATGRRVDDAERVPAAPTPPPAPGIPAAPIPEPAEPAPEPWVVAEGAADPNLLRDAAERRTPVQPRAAKRTEHQDAARLEVLRAVERGELTIEEAAVRLDALDGPGALAESGWV